MAQTQKFRSFDDMIANADVPVLVDFYASWCGPCKMMAGILNAVKAHVGDDLMVVKIDTEKYEQIAAKWEVYALPTLILFKDGRPVDRIEGVLEPQALLARIQQQVPVG